MARTAEDIVRAEVHYCISSLVSTLAEAYGATAGHSLPRGGTRLGINDLTEQAFELASPVPDYEEAAIQAGWRNVTGEGYPPCTQFRDTSDGQSWACSGWQALCEEFDIDPYDREVFEHWIVSDWLADKLAEKGEKVDKDFAGMTVWARTTTGRGIAADSVIEQITKDLNNG